eukprot:2947391-Rhodomonas_salina.1
MCPQGSTKDSQCIPCIIPPHSIPLPYSPNTLNPCPYQCNAGYWSPDTVEETGMQYYPQCCSENAFKPLGSTQCICLPGWVGDGIECQL